MEYSKAIKVYKLALKEFNGWNNEDVNALNIEEFEGDVFFKKLLNI